jgi:hypothetical protein
MHKNYFTTDDLRKAIHVLDFFLGRDGIEITYKLGENTRSLVAPPHYATTLLADLGFIESREITKEAGQDVVWVQVLEEGRNGKEKPLWKTWGHFIDDGARLSQWWALEIVIRHEDTAQLKMVSWEIGREITDPNKN